MATKKKVAVKKPMTADQFLAKREPKPKLEVVPVAHPEPEIVTAPEAAAANKTSSDLVAKMASAIMLEAIDQALWNTVRNDEAAFYRFAEQRRSLAASVLSQA